MTKTSTSASAEPDTTAIAASGRMRAGKAVRLFASAVAVLMSVYQLAVAYLGTPMAEFHYPMHLMFALSVLFLFSAADAVEARSWLRLVWDIAMTAMTVAATAYIFLDPHYPGSRFMYVEALTPVEVAFGAGLLIAILDAARRTIGWVLVVLLAAFLGYAAFGDLLPHPLFHTGYGYERIIEQAYLTPDGIWNQPLAITANYIFLFVLLGTLLLSSGAGRFFTDLASAMTRKSTGGPAKTAVVASTFMGMLSGSSPANVVTTGSFTIPAMRKAGYRPSFAAGVEAVASTGGQLTPPIMGAAAFLMVEFAAVPYIEVMRVAAIPALLYFLAVYFMVDLEARRLKLAPVVDPNMPTTFEILKRQGYLMGAIGVMLGFLLAGYTPTAAGFWAIVSVFVLVALFDGDARKRLLPIAVEAMTEAPKLIAPISVACAIGGVIAGIIIMTGLGVRVADIIIAASGGSMFLALLLTLVVAVILGMGMPTASAYILLAVLLVPGLKQVGVPHIAAHLFVIYCAAKSSITPPVAIASYAAAAIANTNPWTTSLIAFKLGISAFLIPFMFVFGPGLLTYGAPAEVLWTIVTATTGIFALSVAGIGWLRMDLGPFERSLALAVSITLIYADVTTDIIGLVGLMLLFGVIELKRRHHINRPRAVES